MYIYQIYCEGNTRTYIGQTVDIVSRWGNHRYLLRRNRHSNGHLQGAWNKYGEQSFKFEIIQILDTFQECVEAEILWINSFLNSGTPLFNLKSGDWTNHFSEETLKRMADRGRGRVASEETRQRISASNKGKFIADWHRQAVADANKRRINKIESVDKRALSNTGGKAYTFISPEGDQYVNIVNLKRFAREHGLKPRGLQKITQGTQSSYRGWKGYLQNATE